MVRQLYPHLHVRVDSHANAVVVMGDPNDVDAVRNVVQAIDVRNPTTPTLEVIALHVVSPEAVVEKVAPLFPAAHISVASKTSVLLRATPLDNTQIKALISSLDTPPATTAPPTSAPVDTVEVKMARPRDVARAVAHEVPHVRISVSGASLLPIRA